MDLYYSGTITFTRPLSEDEKADIRGLFADASYQFDMTTDAYISDDGKSLEFNFLETHDLDGEFDELADMVKGWPDIEIVEGCGVDYSGDYEGATVFEDGEFSSLNKEESIIRDASDDDLLAELERRGLSMPGGEEEEEEKEHASIVIVVEGGIVQNLYSTDEEIEYDIIDLDTEDPDELDEKEEAINEVKNDDSYVEVW